MRDVIGRIVFWRERERVQKWRLERVINQNGRLQLGSMSDGFLPTIWNNVVTRH